MPSSRMMKDTGLGWLGEIPDAWQIKPFFTVGKELNNKNKGMKESNLLSLSYGNIVLKDIDSNEGLLPESFEGYQIVEPNDLVFRFTDLQNDQRSLRSAISGTTGIITSAYLAVRPMASNPQYLAYLMRAYDQLKVFYSMGGGLRQAMNFQDVRRLLVPVPPIGEQRLIADFLDRETAQIDELIEKQQKLLETLAERRKAVITRAVTRGLDASVPMKDSGVQWLGEIPTHWDAIQIKWLSPVRRGSSPRPIDDEKYFEDNGEWAWVRIADVSRSDGRLRETLQKLSPLGSSLSTKILPGELFVSIAGTVGKPCIAEIKCCIHDGFTYFPHLKMNRDYLFRIFESGNCYAGLGKMGTQLNLNTDTIGSIRVPVPPKAEQEAIATFLKDKIDDLEDLSLKANQMIELLQERRQAIISAAVTGKIDVRESI